MTNMLNVRKNVHHPFSHPMQSTLWTLSPYSILARIFSRSIPPTNTHFDALQSVELHDQNRKIQPECTTTKIS